MRVDAGVSLQTPRRTSQGFLRTDGYVSRPGIYKYLNKDGTVRRELRPRSEAHSPRVLAGYEGAPLTDGHPPEMLKPSNVKQFEVGSVTSPARVDGDQLAASMVWKEPRTIQKIESRKKLQLSPGYAIDLDETSGVDPEFGRYDAIQRNIEINHLALVESARGGDGMCIRMDGVDVDVMVERLDDELSAEDRGNLRDSSFAVPDREGLPINDAAHLRAAMARFGQYKFQDAAEKRAAYNRIVRKAKALGVDSGGFEDAWTDRLDAATRRGAFTMETEEQIRSLKAQLADAEQKAKERSDAADQAVERAEKAEAAVGPLKDRIKELEVSIAAGSVAAETEAYQKEKIRADEAEAAVRRFDERFTSEVKRRTSLMRKAATVLGDEFRMDDLTEREIHSAVVKRLDANADVKSVSDAFLAGKFDTLVELHSKTARSLSRAAESVVDVERRDAANDREKRLREFRDQWKKPLPNSNLRNSKDA